jgi:hypothetical protein
MCFKENISIKSIVIAIKMRAIFVCRVWNDVDKRRI